MRSYRVVPVVAAVLVVSLTGCGGKSGGGFADKSAADIVKTSMAAMKGLKSVHYSGTVTNDGKTVTIDVTASSSGDCQGMLSIGDGGGTTQVLRIGDSVYAKPDEAFWRANAAAAADQIIAAVGDKYVILPAGDSGAANFTSLCDVDSLVAGDDKDATYVKSGTSTTDGQDTVEITTKGGSSDGTIAHVQTGSSHYLVEIEHTGGDNPGKVSFDKFNADFSPTAPAADDVVDLSKLGG